MCGGEQSRAAGSQGPAESQGSWKDRDDRFSEVDGHETHDIHTGCRTDRLAGLLSSSVIRGSGESFSSFAGLVCLMSSLAWFF